MKINRLGHSTLEVSEIGLGCMSLGTDRTHATKIIDMACDAGINFLDTADIYDHGINEEIVGAAIKGKRDKIILATKVGNVIVEGQQGFQWNASKSHIIEAVKQSLLRLGTDYIDLYQLHGGTIEDNIDETIEALEQLKREGLIREYGISSIRPNVIREYVSKSSIVSVMNQYSIVDRRAEEEVLPLLTKYGISVIARGPLAGGALATGRLPVKPVLDYSIDELIQLREKLQEIDMNLTQLAIRYSLSDPSVAVVIPGASSSEQLEQNILAAHANPLTLQQITEIKQLSKENKYTAHR